MPSTAAIAPVASPPRLPAWAFASLCVHLTLVGLARLAAPPREPPSAGTAYVLAAPALSATAVEVGVAGPTTVARTTPSTPRPGGADSAQNLSTDNRGEGGDGRSAEAGRNLAARDDGVNLDPRAMNTLRGTQEQRIRTARDRASPQDDRRTPNPSDDPWTSTGGGILLTRMPSARVAPGAGVTARAGEATTAGDAPESSRPTSGGGALALAQRTAGSQAREAAGVRDRVAGAHRVAGPVAMQRAAVAQGHASTTADQDALRPRDDTDAALLASSLLRAHVAATVHQGAAREEGVGGVGGGGFAGSGGGAFRGGSSRAAGDGDGTLSLETTDARFVRYFGALRRRIHALTARAFPYEDALALRQGTVIVDFVVERSGRVREVAVRRASGVPAYDRNVRDALASATMPAFPASFTHGELRVRAPVAFLNPVVR